MEEKEGGEKVEEEKKQSRYGLRRKRKRGREEDATCEREGTRETIRGREEAICKGVKRKTVKRKTLHVEEKKLGKQLEEEKKLYVKE